MSNSKPSTDSNHLTLRLDDLRATLRGSSMALLVWDRLLSSADKRKLGNNLERQYQKLGLIGIWMKLRQLPQDAATVDLGYQLDLITGAEKDRLEKALGLNKDASPEITTPRWDAIRGRLFWGTTVIRVVKPAKRSHVRRILDAFEEQAWPVQTDDPLPGGRNAHRLHQAVLSLNEGLTRIRFHVSAGGTKIYWVTVAELNDAT